MPDIDGNPDTREMYDHFNVDKMKAAYFMDLAQQLGVHGQVFRPAVKASKVGEFLIAHPECDDCARFAGNLPVLEVRDV